MGWKSGEGVGVTSAQEVQEKAYCWLTGAEQSWSRPTPAIRCTQIIRRIPLGWQTECDWQHWGVLAGSNI